MSKTRILLLGLLLGVIVIGIPIVLNFPEPTPAFPETVPIPLSKEFESNAFRFSYPDGWQYQIPQPNIMFVASTGIVQEQRGTAIAIQRNLNLTYTTDTLEEALEIYLERGPMRSAGTWTITNEMTEVTFNGREAMLIGLEGSDVEGAETMRSEITITRADNGNIYIFAVTLPLELWQGEVNTFHAILASVEILE